MVPSRKRKSWSIENTFATDQTRDEVAVFLREASQKLWTSLEEKAMRGRTVTVKLRTPDFKTATRRLTPEALPQSADELSTIAIALVEKFAFAKDARYRLAGVGISNFLDEEPAQEAEPTLFSGE